MDFLIPPQKSPRLNPGMNAADEISFPFWRIKVEGIHLFKLFYLIDEEFVLLKKLKSSFLKRARELFKNGPILQYYAKNKPLASHITKDDHPDNGKICPGYEPTKIEYTRDSLLWSWRRFKEYWSDIQDGHIDEMAIEARSLRYG